MSKRGGFWLGTGPLVLASGSGTRRKMLEAAGIPLLVNPVALDEEAIASRFVDTGATPRTIAGMLARAKGAEASRQRPGTVILAADQTLEFDGRLAMKPTTVSEARSQLSAMRGRTHHLHSAASLWSKGEALWEGCASAELTMRVFSDAFLDAYLSRMGGQVCRTVGAYEFEALGAHLFEKVEGDHATILGLPLQPLLEALRRLGLLLS